MANPIAQRHFKIISEYISFLPKGKKVLDAGCGNGELSKILQRRGLEVFACDIGVRKSLNRNIHFKKVDLNKSLSYPKDFFDAAICLEVIEHLKNPWLVIQEFHRVIKKNGLLLISSPNTSNPLARIYHLFTGKIWLFKKHDDDHINPISYWELERILLDTGFKKISVLNGVNVIENVTITTNIQNPMIKIVYYLFFKSWDVFHNLFCKDDNSKILFKSFSYIVRAYK